MLRNHVHRLEQHTLVSLSSTLTKCAEMHIRAGVRFIVVYSLLMCIHRISCCNCDILAYANNSMNQYLWSRVFRPTPMPLMGVDSR